MKLNDAKNFAPIIMRTLQATHICSSSSAHSRPLSRVSFYSHPAVALDKIMFHWNTQMLKKFFQELNKGTRLKRSQKEARNKTYHGSEENHPV